MSLVPRPEDRLIACDLETLGFDPDKDPIIEIGLAMVDLNLYPLDVITLQVWSGAHERRLSQINEAAQKGDEQAITLLDLHERSGAIRDAIQYGMQPRHAEKQLLEWLNKNGVGSSDPLVGSSVSFDKGMLQAQFPAVADMFSYRIIDISSVKELCRRYNRDMFAHMEADTKPLKAHRVGEDIHDSLTELKWYIDNFLWTS